MSADLERFYDLIDRLAASPGQGRPLATYTGYSGWPERGVYFFREPGEYRNGSSVPRVVRVGTHALGANAKSTLWGRLRAHRGGVDGRGNHRGSIFRLHVGTALLRRDSLSDCTDTWGRGQSAPRSIRDREVEHERRVSRYIGAMEVLWLAVLDEPGPVSLRAYIERNAIALLSNAGRAVDVPSENWLGRHSPRAEIRESGLWNLNHLSAAWDPQFLYVLENAIRAMNAA